MSVAGIGSSMFNLSAVQQRFGTTQNLTKTTANIGEVNQNSGSSSSQAAGGPGGGRPPGGPPPGGAGGPSGPPPSGGGRPSGPPPGGGGGMEGPRGGRRAPGGDENGGERTSFQFTRAALGSYMQASSSYQQTDTASLLSEVTA